MNNNEKLALIEVLHNVLCFLNWFNTTNVDFETHSYLEKIQSSIELALDLIEIDDN